MRAFWKSFTGRLHKAADAIHRLLQVKPFCYSIVQIFILAFLMTLITDGFSRGSVIGPFVFLFTHPLIFLVNTLIIAIFLAPAILSPSA